MLRPRTAEINIVHDRPNNEHTLRQCFAGDAPVDGSRARELASKLRPASGVVKNAVLIIDLKEGRWPLIERWLLAIALAVHFAKYLQIVYIDPESPQLRTSVSTPTCITRFIHLIALRRPSRSAWVLLHLNQSTKGGQDRIQNQDHHRSQTRQTG